MLDGRPVVTVPVALSPTNKVVIDWSMETGPGQTGDILLGLTPSVVPGNNDNTARSAC